jgi:hypothetical protein
MTCTTALLADSLSEGMMSDPSGDRDASPLAELENLLQCHWEHIGKARQRTRAALNRLSGIIEGLPNADTSVIVHGSLARLECTQGSDLDWTLLVDGQADASVQKTFLAIKEALFDSKASEELGLEKPGKEGTFGTLAFSQPMMQFIGGEEDSNSNTTRRVLLLLEGLPIGERRDAFERVRSGILRRYLDEDRGLLRTSLTDRSIRWVPLFLLNDFTRYWRTMAVDFAYKQFDRGSQAYALRSIKLGLSRKLLFASGLLACFWCDPAISKIDNQKPDTLTLIDCLNSFFDRTPLERLALFFVVHIPASNSEFLRKTATELFSAYDAFLGMLEDSDIRKHLKDLGPDEEEKDVHFVEARTFRRNFRLAIQEMFLGGDSPLRQHSIEKGVF